MKAQPEGTRVTLTVGGEKQVLTLKEAVSLQASLGAAIQDVLEEKLRLASGLLVTPEDVAWQTIVAETEL